MAGPEAGRANGRVVAPRRGAGTLRSGRCRGGASRRRWRPDHAFLSD